MPINWPKAKADADEKAARTRAAENARRKAAAKAEQDERARRLRQEEEDRPPPPRPDRMRPASRQRQPGCRHYGPWRIEEISSQANGRVQTR